MGCVRRYVEELGSGLRRRISLRIRAKARPAPGSPSCDVSPRYASKRGPSYELEFCTFGSASIIGRPKKTGK